MKLRRAGDSTNFVVLLGMFPQQDLWADNAISVSGL